MIKAEIVKEIDDCLWLHVHRENEEGCSYPLLGDEIDAILEACKTYKDNSNKEYIKNIMDSLRKKKTKHPDFNDNQTEGVK